MLMKWEKNFKMKIIFERKNLRSLNLKTQEWYFHLGTFPPCLLFAANAHLLKPEMKSRNISVLPNFHSLSGNHF